MTSPASAAARNVVVTGGADGLGAAVARTLLDADDNVFVLDVQQPPYQVAHEVVDLGNTRAAEDAVRKASAELGGIDAVVTCAGTDKCGKLADVPGDEWDQVIRVNLLGTAAVVRAALPDLLERQGRVVTVASTLGLRALSDASAYCASKFGVVGLSRALAVELAGQVGVTMLVPGGMSTSFFDDRDEQYRPGPDAQLNDPANVARAVQFALDQPPGCEVRELIVTPSTEPSWP
jgi:NAD(P)-dependent dehydrogenase (short-subunit alcohol dehydrogenase family)